MKSTSMAPARRHLPPQRGEMAGLDHQDLIARRQRIDDRRFPGAGARRGKNDDRSGGFEDFLATIEYGLAEFGEFGAAMVNDRHVHGPQHAVRHRAWAGNLQEMASLMLCHGVPQSGFPRILHSIRWISIEILVTIPRSTVAPSRHMFRP